MAWDMETQKGYGPCRNTSGRVVFVAAISHSGCFCSKEQLLEQLRQAENERDCLWDKFEEHNRKWEEYKAAVDDQNNRRRGREEWQKIVNVATEFIPLPGAGFAVSEVLDKANSEIEQIRYSYVRTLYNKTVEKYNEIRNWYNGIRYPWPF